MDVLDLFFKKFAYKFPKGYPDMNNEQDINLLADLLEGLGINLNENSIMNSSAKAIEKIINSPEGKQYNFKLQSKKNRLGNLDKISKEDFLNLLNQVFPGVKVTVHAPNEGPNVKPLGSSKYNMYEFTTEDGDVRIILSGGANEGEKYEQNFIGKLKSSAGLPLDDIEDSNIKKLYQTLNINPENLTQEDIDFTGTADTKRSLNVDKPENIGPKIADVTIKTKGKEYYISLKNITGHVFYNGGNVPFIVFDENKNVVYDPSKFDRNEIIKNIFEIFNIDPEKVAKGLNEYIAGEGEIPNSYESTNISEPKVLQNLLASGFGYGYYYVKEIKNGSIDIKPLLTIDDAYKAIGNISSAQIKYPNSNTKALTVKLPLKSDLFGEVNCYIEFRNTSGYVLPLALKIKTSK
jgi:hypothetical protein